MRNIRFLLLTILLTFSLCLTSTVKAVTENEIENIEESEEVTEVLENIEVTEITNENPVTETPTTDGQATTAGEVDVTKEAVIVTDSTTPTTEGDSRTAEITIEVDAKGFEETTTPVTYDAIDVALVIDASQSMIDDNNCTTITVDGRVRSVSRLAAAKIAAKDLVKALLEANPNTRISLSIFNEKGFVKQILTSDLSTLNTAIDAASWDYSTNIQDGINKGANTLIYLEEEKNNQKVLVLLSDGEANESTYNDADDNYGKKYKYKNTTYTYEDGNDIEYTYTCNKYGECSDSGFAKTAADYFKETHNITFYTIGLGTETSANDLLKDISGAEKDANNNTIYPRFIFANSGDTLVEAFKTIGKKITTPYNAVATDAILTDVVPNDFIITTEERTRLQTTYSNITIEDQIDGSTKLVLNIGNITTDGIKLIFKASAKDNYHGSMYTNEEATLVFKPVSNNPYNYNLVDGKVTLTLANPAVVIPAIAANDNIGNVNTTESKEILTNTLLSNDNNSKFIQGTQIENVKSINDFIEIVSSTSKGTLNINSTSTGYIYTPNMTNQEQTDSFVYKIKSIITLVDNTIKTVYSNQATVNINVKPVATSYTVHHYIKGTTESASNDETYSTGLYVGDKATATAKNLSNYTLVGSESTKEITLIDGTNEITFYYELKNAGTLTVHHYLKDTTIIITGAADEIVNGKVTDPFEATARLDLTNYQLVSENSTVEGNLTIEPQIVTFYYEKIMGTLIVNYIDENGKPLKDSLITEEQKGTPYQTTPLDLKDIHYVLVNTEGSEEGTYTDEEIEVNYIYQFVGGRGGDEPVISVPNTGINDSYGLEIIFIASISLFLGAIFLRKKYN